VITSFAFIFMRKMQELREEMATEVVMCRLNWTVMHIQLISQRVDEKQKMVVGGKVEDSH